jgi:hypothetical protein
MNAVASNHIRIGGTKGTSTLSQLLYENPNIITAGSQASQYGALSIRNAV